MSQDHCSLPDFGTSQLQAMRSIIAARRLPPKELSMWQKTTSMFQKHTLPTLIGTALSHLTLQGFIPEDFIEHSIQWEQLPYSVDDCLDFGFTWTHMLQMNFKPHHFKSLEWRHFTQLQLDADAMMKTCLSIHDLVALKLTPQQLHKLKWSWAHITTIGGTADNIKISPQDRAIYFGRTTQETSTSASVSTGSVPKFSF